MEAPVTTRRKMNRYRKAQLWFIWPMIAVPIAHWLVFFLYMNMSSFVQAFQDTAGNFTTEHITMAWNSITGKVDSSDKLSIGIRNTFMYYTVSEFIIFPLRIIMSYFIYKQIAGYKVFRIVFYLPCIVSAVTMTGVYQEFISPLGPLGAICTKWGIEMPSQGLLATASTANTTIMTYVIWSGLTTHLYISGAMAKIPVEVLESARLDGITSGKELVSIVVPLIWPTISTMLILSLTSILSASGPILLLSPDPWSTKTYTVSFWLWEKVYAGGSFMKGKYSLVSAVGLILTAFTVPAVLLIRKLVEKIPAVEY